MLLSSFHYTSGLHCITPPSVSLQSSISTNLSNPRKRSSFIPLRSPFPSLHFAPTLAFHPSITHASQNIGATLHPSQFTSFHSLTTLAFFHPIQRYALPLIHPRRINNCIVLKNKKAKQVRRVRSMPSRNVVSRSSPTGFAIFFI